MSIIITEHAHQRARERLNWSRASLERMVDRVFYFGIAVNRTRGQVARYEKGQSDAVKQQYWVARDNQRPKTDDGYEETYYEIDVPQSDRDGVRREPTKRVIRVVMPKEES